MAPIPEQIRSSQFQNLKLEGDDFLLMVDALKDLMKRPRQILVPPSEHLDVDGVSLSIPKLFVVQGPFPSSLYKMFENEMVPWYVGQLTPDSPLQVFGITLGFDKEQQHIIISSKKHEVKLQHDGLHMPISAGNKMAILGLALLPDSLWPDSASSGFIFGCLKDSPWDNPWHAHPWSISLPDPKGVLSWRKSEPHVLENFTLDSLQTSMSSRNKSQEGELRANQAQTYLLNIKPTGVLFDSRGR